MGYISIFTCVFLTIERWIAVVKPKTYRALKPKHAVVAVIIIWIWGMSVNITPFFRIKYSPEKNLCEWAPLPFAKKELPWIDLIVQSIIPYVTIIVLYAHIYCRMKKLPFSNSHSQLKKITTVALCACSALIIGWLPGRITFMLSKYDYVHPDGILHTSFVMIAFCNSCVNPWLYGMCSSKFRGEYKAVFGRLFMFSRKYLTQSAFIEAPDSVTPLHRHLASSSMQRGTLQQTTV
jgi:hypothetical protein